MFSLDQYAAARDAAVIGERSSRGTIVLTGSDRRSFLHALLTNDIASLAPGKGTYAAYLTPQGRMISDMSVFETGQQLLLGVERAVAAPLAERLDKLIFAEDVQVRDASQEIEELGVHGPRASDIIERAAGISVSGLDAQYDNLTSRFTVARDDAFGVPGFEIFAAHGDAESIRQTLLDAGALVASPETLETLRIEAGRPRFEVDMFTDTIPLEAGIEDRAISFTKGCYVGQEVIVRVMHRGHGRVARRLVRLVLPGSAAPVPGEKILSADQQVGAITSAGESPRAGAPLAFGYVQRDYAASGTELTVGGSKAVVYQPID
jgi:folate-binding protein YgfZ